MFKVVDTINSVCANCDKWTTRVVFVCPEYGRGILLCLECAAELRKRLTPAWKEHIKAQAKDREMTPERISMWQQIIAAHSAGVKMRDMTDAEFLHVLEVFEGEQCMFSVQSRILQEAIRRLGGEDCWTDGDEEATERQ